ncbi:hypothetical protein KM043_003822 [Ampulex compressa]|nr:hypothetical protein KM043_003822 [Ampulex compressa]
MAWLSGLADKAENLLNKIDKNTAAVLNKDKYDLPQSQLTEVTWIPPESCIESTTSKTSDSPKSLAPISSVPNVMLHSKDITPCKDEELLTFLNASSIDPNKTEMELLAPLAECTVENIDSLSESPRSCASPSSAHASLDVLNNDHRILEATINNESSPFKSKASVKDNETYDEEALGAAVNTGLSTKEHINNFHQINEYEHRRNMETTELINITESETIRKYLREMENGLEDRNDLLGKRETDHQKEIIILNEKLTSSDAEKAQLYKQVLDLQFALERSRLDLNSARSGLEQHKARALKTLQEKDKLIAELRTNVSNGMDDATVMELNQLRHERDALREENLQISEQIRVVREELMHADLKLEKMRQKSMETSIQAQETLAVERRRRLDAEEDARLHSEEIRALKEEMLSQRKTYALQLQKQDSEITRFRMQLSAVSTPSSEVESRLASLTQTLVLKQQALEGLTTERNALRLQLEKIEHEFRNSMGSSRRNVSYNSINDTDDAKAQVPTFLIETPFDTGVTRRVKRAYSSLDAISIRTGVFLRRYPLARILVLIYMALLQFWVVVVLLSQSPEAH